MQQMELVLITHKVETEIVPQRAIDGYVNATAMCKACGKQINDYLRLKSTDEFLIELSTDTGIPVSMLVQIVKGGYAELQGTWVHPDVAINLGQWCSPKFAVAVSKWIREWMSGKAKPYKMPYHVQRYIANRTSIPVTHFSMLNELLFGLVAPLESLGYVLPEDMVPDISTGRMFCKWLRDEKGLDTNTLPTYRHEYADGRVVPAKLYPNEVLADFRKYFNEVWLIEKAKKYFVERDPSAAEYVDRYVLSLTYVEQTLIEA